MSNEIRIARLAAADIAAARQMFALLDEAFEVEGGVLSDDYIQRLLARDSGWWPPSMVTRSSAVSPRMSSG